MGNPSPDLVLLSDAPKSMLARIETLPFSTAFRDLGWPAFS